MSTWNCPKCNEELGELNGFCEFCYIDNGSLVYNPDKYYIRDIRIPHICEAGDKPMTPQEELFAQLFNHEKSLVKDMDTLSLRAHREELSKIAFEARARLTAVDDEEQGRKRKSAKANGPAGFERNLNIDEATTEAINTIKERQKRLTGKEKMLANLISLYEKGGMSHEEAEKTATSAMGAGNILARLKDKESKDIIKDEAGLRSPLSQENGFTIKNPSEQQIKPTTPIFNPFAKKEDNNEKG